MVVLLSFVMPVVGELLAGVVAGSGFLRTDEVSTRIKAPSSLPPSICARWLQGAAWCRFVHAVAQRGSRWWDSCALRHGLCLECSGRACGHIRVSRPSMVLLFFTELGRRSMHHTCSTDCPGQVSSVQAQERKELGDWLNSDS